MCCTIFRFIEHYLSTGTKFEYSSWYFITQPDQAIHPNVFAVTKHFQPSWPNNVSAILPIFLHVLPNALQLQLYGQQLPHLSIFIQYGWQLPTLLDP